MLYFSPHITSASVLRGERQNPEIAVFHLVLHAVLLATHKHIKKITWSQLNHPSVKMIDCVHQTGPRKGAYHPAVCCLHARHLPSRSQCRLLCQRRELFFIKPGVKVNEQCCWDILLSQQILDAIKHLTIWWQFCFSATQRTGVFNIVQLLQCKKLNFLSPELWPCNSPELDSTDHEV